jgi:hypothetical protein
MKSYSISTTKINQNRVLVFVHVPKAAGATLRWIMDQQYNEKAVYRSDMHLYSSAFREFQNLPKEQLAKIRCLIGHLPYGIHEHLPGPVDYVTLLRNPVDRFLSKYAYLRNNKWVADELKVKEKQLESLEAFIEMQVERNAVNFQTRQISGCVDLLHATPPYDKPMTNDSLETAKKNLKQEFAVVGLQEQFNASLLLMKHAFGWDNVFYHKQNVTSRPVPRKKISSKIRDLIEQHNQLDIQLVNFAKELFAEQISAYGPSFEKDLKSFEKKNNRFVFRDSLWQKARNWKWKTEDLVNRGLGRET